MNADVLYLNVVIILSLFVVRKVEAQGNYKAAVVEYRSIETSHSTTRMLDNVQEYKKFMAEAKNQDVDIIVFPEYGLTSDIDNNLMHQYGIEVPESNGQIVCYSKDNNNDVLRELSCATLERGLYVVVNVIERDTDSRNSTIFYNTTIVFDRYGRIIAKYRKINLFLEPKLTPGRDIVTFKADFGVKFGIITCYDITSKVPGQSILKDSTVTDIISTFSWYSELPFGISVSVQAGYALATNVNLLAPNRNKPESSRGGSGIYVLNDYPAEVYISNLGINKMLIKNVRSPYKRNNLRLRHETTSSRKMFSQFVKYKLEANEFATNQENLENYTFTSLDPGLETHKTICNVGDSYCCTFNVTISKLSSNPNDYVYKLAIFHGVRQNAGWNTWGIRTCALLACHSDDTKTCGRRLPNAPDGPTFGKIQVTGTFIKNENTFDIPSTLLTNLRPIDPVSFRMNDLPGGKTKLTLSTQTAVKSVFAFGFLGRLFDYDNLETGSRI